jgi:hypothetical protein
MRWVRIPSIVDSDSRPSWTAPGSRRQAGLQQLERGGKKTHSVAEVYAAYRDASGVKPVAAPMLLAANE